MSDKEFLERCFPLRCQDVVPVERHSNLAPVAIPNTVKVLVLGTAALIDAAMDSILQRLQAGDESHSFPIFVDTEWNVRFSQYGRLEERGRTAVVQIATDTEIYILQVCSHC
jgi:hypothetical protein